MSSTNTPYFNASLLAFECIKAITNSHPDISQDTNQEQRIISDSVGVAKPEGFEFPLFPSGFSFYDVDEVAHAKKE